MKHVTFGRAHKRLFVLLPSLLAVLSSDSGRCLVQGTASRLLSCRRKKGGAWFCRRPPRSAVMSSGCRAVHGTGILTTCEVRLKDQGRMVS